MNSAISSHFANLPMISHDHDEEFAPLNQRSSQGDAEGRSTDGHHGENGPGHRRGDEDDDADAGYSNYAHPNRLRTGRYNGYCTLSVGRVSMHDSWNFDEHDEEQSRRRRSSSCNNSDTSSDASDECDRGDFVSFWRHSIDDGDDSSGSGCSASRQRTRPQHQHSTPQYRAETSERDHDNGDLVETTLRPVPLMYREFQGGLGRNGIRNGNGNPVGSWFQREQGVANAHFNAQDERLKRRRRHRNGRPLWGFGRRREFSDSSSNDEDEDEDEDANSLLESSSSGEVGHCVGTPMQSPRCGEERKKASDPKPCNSNIFGGNGRSQGGMMSSPIVRPFLWSSRRGFADDPDPHSNRGMAEDECDMARYSGDDIPSRKDRAAVVESIAQGIVGANDSSLQLSLDGVNAGTEHPPPNLLQRIFVSPFRPNSDGNSPNNKQASIIQLHNLVRKEDWTLATELLQSKPDLAKTWHCISRLYGGRYDGEALPIHAACALNPPASFVEMLAVLYPQGLVEKDKSFGRVPLHVACRSVADSSVIKVLCDKDPKCVEMRDSLMRVPLHYVIKNYYTLGDDDIMDIAESGGNNEDGLLVLKTLLETGPDCVRAADHRGWLPLHVACSVSSRKGMLRVMKLLLEVWPESVNAATEKKSDIFACVDMAGKHHPTKFEVVSLLKDAKFKLERNNDVQIEQDDNSAAVSSEHDCERLEDPSSESSCEGSK